MKYKWVLGLFMRLLAICKPLDLNLKISDQDNDYPHSQFECIEQRLPRRFGLGKPSSEVEFVHAVTAGGSVKFSPAVHNVQFVKYIFPRNRTTSNLS